MLSQKDQLKKFQPRKQRPSIKKDGVNPKDFNHYNLPWSCEDCVHFSNEKQNCTLGFPVEPFLKKNQMHNYELSGKFALCRFHEID